MIRHNCGRSTVNITIKRICTCSPGCKHIFEQEPHKYAQIWWPAEAYASGEFGEDPVAGFIQILVYLLMKRANIIHPLNTSVG